MKTIKWFLLLLLLCGSSSGFAEVCQSPLAYLKVETPEHLSVIGQLNVTLKLHFLDSAIISSEIGITLPAGWSTPGINSTPIGQIYKDGDEVSFNFQLNYPVANLPYYPKEIPLGIVLSHVNDTIYDSVAVQTTAHIYFTPYNTVEVMDMQEYNHPLRKWLQPAVGEEEPERVFIPREEIPISNIPDTFQVVEEWQNDFQITFVPGLAYAIPMMPIHPDSIATMSGGLSKIGYHYIGSVQGNIRGRFRHDPTGNLEHHRPLNGLKVAVYTYNIFSKLGIKIGEGVTDANGNFNCDINTNLAFSERSIFLKVFSQIDEFDIQATSIPFNSTEYEVFGETLTLIYNNGNPSPPINTGLIIRSNHLQATHLAGQAFRFCNARSGRTLTNGLRIRAYTLSTMFVPNWVNGREGLSIFGSIIAKATSPGLIYTGGLTKPTIFLHNGDAHDENTVYHEFGHFLMWQLQGKRWVNPLTGSFAKHEYTNEYNTQIAWTEGWADGVMSMTDGFYFNQDNEMNFDESLVNHEDRRNFSTFTPRTIIIMGNPITFFRNTVNNGVRSEYYISTTLLDLWDGADKYDPIGNITSRTQLFTNTTPPTLVGYPDEDNPVVNPANWDNISLSFQELCNIVAEGNNGNVHENVQDFYHRLIRDKDCNERRDIRNIFESNRIQWDINNFWADRAPFSTDEIFGTRSYNMYINGSTVTMNHEVDVNRLSSGNDWNAGPSYNLAASTLNQTTFLSDNLEVINGAFISFNRFIPSGFQAQFLSQSPGLNPAASSRLFANICSGTTLNIHNGGTIELGDRDEFSFADLRVTSGSTLQIGAPGENNIATLRINNNSRLIIEPGGRLVIFPNSRIILDGDNAILDVQGTVRIEDNATFTYIPAPERINGASGFVRMTPPTGGTNIQTNGYGHGARFSLSGETSHTDKVLEVTTGTLSDGGCDFFTLQRGRAELASNAQISVACSLIVNYFTVTSTTGIQNNHKGLQFFGQGHSTGSSIVSDVSINDLRISYGQSGISAMMAGTGSSITGVTLQNLRLDNCGTGISSNSKFLKIKNSIINNCGIGWDATDMEAGNLIENSVFKNSYGAAAVQFYGQSGSDLVINQTDINSNTDGVRAFNTSVTAKCSKIKNHIHNAFYMQNSSLFMNSYINGPDGKVDLSDNAYALFMENQNSPGSTFYIKNGYNNFSQLKYPGVLPHIYARLSFCPVYGIIEADRNQWYNSTLQCQENNIIATNGIGGLSCSTVCVTDNYPITYNGDCYTNSLSKGDNQPNLSINRNYTADSILNLQYLRTAEQLQSDTNFIRTFSELKSLFYSNKVKDVDDNKPLMMNIYYDMMKAISNGINNGEIKAAITGIISDLVKIQDYLLQRIPAKKENYSYRYRISLDKADIYALAGERTIAMTLLDGMQAWIKNEDVKELEFKYCLFDAEEKVISGKVKKEEFFSIIESCRKDFYAPLKEENNSAQISKFVENDFKLYPNPAQNEVNVEVYSDKAINASIEIKDMNLKSIFTLKNDIKLTEGINTFKLPIQSIANGVYFLQIRKGDKIINQKFVIIR